MKKSLIGWFKRMTTSSTSGGNGKRLKKRLKGENNNASGSTTGTSKVTSVLSSPPPISPLSDAPPLSPSPANAKQKQASNPALAVVSPVAAPVTIEKIIPTTPAPPPPQSNINYQNTNKPSAHQPIVQPQAPKYLQQQQQELIAPRPPKQQTVVNSELVAPRPPKQQQQQQHQYQLLPIQPPPVNVLVKQQQSQFPVRYNAEDENNATTLLETVRSQIEFDQPIAPASRFTIPPLEQIRFHVNELESNTAANYTLDRSQYLRLDGPDQKPMELGTGSYGHVVAAIHVPTGKMVAMKSIPKMKMIRREDRLRCELEIMSRVHHRNVLRLLDWGFGTYHIYLVMEIARGKDLLTRISSVGKFYEKDAIEAVTAIVDALAYLHRLGIVHRDLKPENILLRDPTYKSYSDLVIADFGISRIMSEYDGDMLRTRIGSGGYVAPEVLIRQGHDKQCDMWSLGIIVYILLSGTMPYKAENFEEELQIILSQPIRFYQSTWKAVSKEAKDFVQGCLQVDPAVRMTSEEAMSHPWLTEMEETSITSNDLFELGLGDALETERTRRAAEFAEQRRIQQQHQQQQHGDQQDDRGSRASSVKG